MLDKSYSFIYDEPIRFMLYDKETEMILGNISEVSVDEDWENIICYKIYTVEHKIDISTCPKCNFWMVERKNEHGHRFMGCSGYPECDYSIEIDKLYDDE